MRRVVKVGGSLLLKPDLLESLSAWFSRQVPAENVVMVGGGELINAIRDLDAAHRGGDAVETHWRCVELLCVTLQLFADWTGWPCLYSQDELRAASDSGFNRDRPTLVSATAFYNRDRCSVNEVELPLDWRTTTDAIAGALANFVAADELVLLKSCEIDASTSIAQLSRQGVVDEALPTIESELKAIRIEQLV